MQHAWFVHKENYSIALANKFDHKKEANKTLKCIAFKLLRYLK